MAAKDSQDAGESDGTGRDTTGTPRTAGGPAGGALGEGGSSGEILSITPAEMAREEQPPPADAAELPVEHQEDEAGEEALSLDGAETEELALQELDDAEPFPVEHLRETGDDPGATPFGAVGQASDEPVGVAPELEPPAAEPVATPSDLEELPEAVTPETVADAAEYVVGEAARAGPAGTDPEASVAEPGPASPETRWYPSEHSLRHEPEPPAPPSEPVQQPEPPPAQEATYAAAATAVPASSTLDQRPLGRPWLDRAEALRLIKKGARYAAYGAGGYLALVVFLILAYRIVNPPGSMLMLFRLLGGTSISRTWVPIERISPNLIRAVVVAEDGRFCDHWGIDFDAIREAIRRSGDGTPRGASTISMQVAKNLFLWPSKSYVRKVIEVPLTFLIELIWPKRRILEIYLNVAEWGPGIFGAEAAAQYHFRRPASRLGEREAALLAASLPNPVRRDAGDPGPATSRKARVIQARMHVSGPVAACVTGSR